MNIHMAVEEDEGLTEGETAGLTVGLIVFATLVALAVVWKVKHTGDWRDHEEQNNPNDVP
jgi:hypothetical protein